MTDPLIEELVARRRSERRSQREIAETMGTVQSAVSEIETGLTKPTLPVFRAYARALGFDLMLTPTRCDGKGGRRD